MADAGANTDEEANRTASGRRKGRAFSWRQAGLLCLVVLLGVVLRTAQLSEQSIWFDEHNTIPHSAEIPFSEHFSFIQSVNPDHMPLYFLLLYGWHVWVEDSLLSFRLLSVFFAALTMGAIFWLGRWLYGPRVGLLAALCYALSPLHIYFDQAIRYYAFVGFWGTVSLGLLGWALYRHRWWPLVAGAVINAALAWIHLTTVLFLPCQGVVLLVGGFGFRRTFLWCLGQLPACAAVLWWLPTMGNAQVTWYELPSLLEWLNDLLGDDAVSLSTRSLSQDSTFSFFPEALATVWLSAHWLFDAALLLVVAAALGLTIRQCVRWLRTQGFGFTGSLSPRRAVVVGLLLYALLPFFLLSLISVLWEPVLLPRYTLNGSIATYILMGVLLARASRRRGMALTVVALLLLYGYQLSLSMTGPTRTDWLRVGESIERYGTAEDLVIVCEAYDDSMTGARLLRLNMGDTEHRIREAFTLEGAADLAVEFLDDAEQAAALDQGTPMVWLVYQHFGAYPTRDVEGLIQWYGYDYVERQYTDVVVARIFRRDTESDRESGREMREGNRPRLSGWSLDEMLSELGLSPADSERRWEMERAIRWAYDGDGLPSHPGDFATLAIYALEKDPEVAAAAAQYAIREMPEMSWGHLALGFVQLCEGDYIGMGHSFARALRDEAFPRYQGVLTALAAGDLDEARVRVRWLRESGSWAPPALSNCLGLSALY